MRKKEKKKKIEKNGSIDDSLLSIEEMLGSWKVRDSYLNPFGHSLIHRHIERTNERRKIKTTTKEEKWNGRLWYWAAFYLCHAHDDEKERKKKVYFRETHLFGIKYMHADRRARNVMNTCTSYNQLHASQTDVLLSLSLSSVFCVSPFTHALSRAYSNVIYARECTHTHQTYNTQWQHEFF